MNVAPDTPRLLSLRALIQIKVSSTFSHGIPPPQRMKYSPRLHVQWKCPCWVQQAPRSWNKINCITTFFNFNLSTFSKSKFHDFWIWLYPFIKKKWPFIYSLAYISSEDISNISKRHVVGIFSMEIREFREVYHHLYGLFFPWIGSS